MKRVASSIDTRRRTIVPKSASAPDLYAMSAYVPIDRAIECVVSRTDVEDLKFCLASPPNLVDDNVEAENGVVWASARRTCRNEDARSGRTRTDTT